MKSFFYFTLLFLSLAAAQNKLDTSLSENKIINQQPKIEFYRSQLPFNNLNEFDTSMLRSPEVLEFPFALWSKGLFNKKESKDYGTILLNTELPDTKHQYYYYFDRITGGCEIWINNKYHTSFGYFSKNLELSSSKGTPLSLKLPKQKHITLTILISNSQHTWGGGINLKPKIFEEAAFLEHNQKAIIKSFSAIIILLLLICYQCFLYFLYKEKKYIYMAIICLAFILRSIVIKNAIIYDYIPQVPFFIIQKLRYASIYLACISVLLFYKEFIPKHINKKVFLFFLGIQSLGILGCIVLSTYQVTQLAEIMRFFLIAQIAYSFWFIGLAIKKKELYARLLMISIIVVFCCLINNVLHATNKINTFFIIVYLPLIYLLVQTIINHYIQRDINGKIALLSNDIANKKKENQNLKLETLRRIREKQRIKTSLKELSNKTAGVNTIIAEMQKNNGEDEKSKILKTQIVADQQEFTKKLLALHPNLTKIDLEIATFILLKKSRNEIADLRGVSITSVKTSRSRLRKKLEISKEVLLDDYLQSML